MVALTSGAPTFLHLGFEHMPDSALELVPGTPLVVAERRPVVVVEIFDDLKRPTSFEDVAADQFLLQFVGDLAVTRLPQFVHSIPEQKVGVTHHLMERVEVAACALQTLQRFGQFPDRGHGVVGDALGTSLLERCGLMFFGFTKI